MHESRAPNVALVVDDDEVFRYAIGRIIHHAGWTVCEAAGGDEAVAYCRSLEPRLILLDLQMPGRDGFETCEALRTQEHCRSATIIAMSGVPKHAVEDRALRSGFDLYLLKPISENLLRRILDGAATGPPGAR